MTNTISELPKVVYIPTRGRWDRLDKIADAWVFWGFTVVFVTEHDQEEASVQWRQRYCGANEHPAGMIKVLYIADRPGNGIGWVRDKIVTEAHRQRLDAFIMSDDDCYPDIQRVTPSALLEAVRTHPVLACAASHSQQDWMLKGVLSRRPNEVILAPHGIGYQLFAINTERAVEIGGFDASLKVYEDSEFHRQGVQFGYPWSQHTGVILKKTGRCGDPGGIQDYMAEAERERYAESVLAILSERWGPKFIRKTAKGYRQEWAKFYDHHLPGWRKWSAIHGGDINEMLG